MNLQFDYDRHYWPPAPVIDIAVDGYSSNVPIMIRALIDSGADGTMIPYSVLEKVEAAYTDSVRMRGVTGSSEQKDRYRVRIQIGEIVVKGIDAVAVDDEDGSLIGRDVLSQLVVTLDGLAAETRVSNQ
jgi:predicted aspartyl protease